MAECGYSHCLRSFLLAISEDLTEKDYKNMKFLCVPIIGKSRMEKVTSVVELFDQLLFSNALVSKGDGSSLDPLKYLVQKSTNGNATLVEKIKKFEKNEWRANYLEYTQHVQVGPSQPQILALPDATDGRNDQASSLSITPWIRIPNSMDEITDTSSYVWTQNLNNE